MCTFKCEASNVILLETTRTFLTVVVDSFNRDTMRISMKRTVSLWRSRVKVSLAWRVGCRLASEPTNLTFFDGSQCFWCSDAVGRSDDFVYLWLLMFVPPRYENKLQLISVSFPNYLLSRGIQVWNDIMDPWFLIVLDFFVLYQWKSLLSWITSFLVSLGWVSYVYF